MVIKLVEEPPPEIFTNIDYSVLIVYDQKNQRFEGAKISLEHQINGMWVLTIRLPSGEEKSFTQYDVSVIRHR